MKNFLILYLMITIVSCKKSGVQISSDFDHGSIDMLEEVERGYFRGTTKHWPARVWHSEPVGSSHAHFLAKDFPSGSLELTQSFSEQGAYLDISDYHRYGVRTVRGFLEYFGFAE